jgi:molybdate transport system ATP-binding protein
VRLRDQLATQIVMLRNGRVTALGGVKVLTGASLV